LPAGSEGARPLAVARAVLLDVDFTLLRPSDLFSTATALRASVCFST
jgi:hypothetical protein